MSQSILRNERPVAIVLGGAIAHIKLVNSLKARGYHVIIVDYYDHPPAKPFCDEHIQESALDEAKVLDIAKTRNAALVICLCLDLPLVNASTVSEALGLPSLISAHTAKLVTDKSLMKQVMLENGIPTSRYMIADDDLRDMYIDLNFPLIVKPVDSTGSQGVKKVMDIEEAERSRKEAVALSRSGKAIIEEWCDGEEWNIHCQVIAGRPHVLLVAQKRNLYREDIGANVFLGSRANIELSPDEQAAMEVLVTSLAKAFGITNSPLLVQLFHKDGDFRVIEIAARIGGGMGQHIVELVTGCDLIEASIDLLLGQEPQSVAARTRDKVYGTIILYARSGSFHSITGLDQLVDEGAVHAHYCYLAQGTVVPAGLTSKNRVGAVIVQANSSAEMEETIKNVIARIDVLAMEGHSLFARNLYDHDR